MTVTSKGLTILSASTHPSNGSQSLKKEPVKKGTCHHTCLMFVCANECNEQQLPHQANTVFALTWQSGRAKSDEMIILAFAAPAQLARRRAGVDAQTPRVGKTAIIARAA